MEEEEGTDCRRGQTAKRVRLRRLQAISFPLKLRVLQPLFSTILLLSHPLAKVSLNTCPREGEQSQWRRAALESRDSS